MRILLLLIVCSALCAFTFHDGDTITKISYRLAYIDAPELSQTCHARGVDIPIGQLSQQHLATISHNQIENCKIVDIDRYGRAVAYCPYNMQMVLDGMAICYDKYIDNRKILNDCHKAQSYAKEARLGLWSCDDFIEPATWRKRK